MVKTVKMKVVRTVFLVIGFLLFYCNSFSQQKSTLQSATIRLTTKSDTIQYTLGAYIGQWFNKNGFTITNRTLFERGMDDALQNKKLAVNDSAISPLVSSYQLSVQNARSKAMEDQLFAGLKGKSGVGVLPDGVHYIVVKAGNGLRPAAKDSIVINAIGIFPDGTVFEDTYQKKRPISTLPGNLIPGLNETIQLMPEGSVWRIFIPSVLGYGPAGLPNVIPPNTALVFDVTLVRVKQNR